MRTDETPMIATYTGSLAPGVLIADQTNPWVEVDGEPVDWMEHPLTADSTPNPEGCEVCPKATPGALPAMDTPQGIQRCDECQVFEGDLEAAQSVAELVGGVVKFEMEED